MFIILLGQNIFILFPVVQRQDFLQVHVRCLNLDSSKTPPPPPTSSCIKNFSICHKKLFNFNYN